MLIRNLGHQASVAKPPAKHPGKMPACWIEYVGEYILIDVGPDVLSQITSDEIKTLTAILLTHAHQDAISGLPTLNSEFKTLKKAVPIYVEKKTWQHITRKYSEGSLGQLDPHFIEPRKTFKIGDISVRPLRIEHGSELFPALGFNFDRAFVYSSDGYLAGSGIDEYELEYWSGNVLAILDGAYWDRQVGHNHTAVLPNLEAYLFLGNKYTLFTGYGNQWPKLDQAQKTLNKELKILQESHEDVRIKEMRPVRDGEKFSISMNKYLEGTRLTKPSFESILGDPKILTEISRGELLMTHLRCHQLWHVEGVDEERVLQVHILVVREILRRGFKHHRVDSLDTQTYEVLGRKAKIYQLFLDMPDEYLIASDIIKIVGSSLIKSDPGDIDIISPEYAESLVKKVFEKYHGHLIGSVQSHGEGVNMYDLVLKKKDFQISYRALPDYTKTYSVAQMREKLLVKGVDTFVIEPYLEGEVKIVVDSDQRVIYEQTTTPTGTVIITDCLAIRRDSLFEEILLNRMFFMCKKWLDQMEGSVLLPHRWVVKREQLFSFLAQIREDVSKVIIRPACSQYYDGKFVLDLSSDLVTCPACKIQFDYCSLPEACMGAVECPGCHSLIDQEGQLLRAGPNMGSVPDPIPGGYLPKPVSARRRRRKKPAQKAEQQLKPIHIFTPLKATGTAYHELEFFSIEDAWNFFGKYYIAEEKSVRVEVKYDGLRSILQNDGEKQILYFEDAKRDRLEVLPSLRSELKELGDIILDGELMEKDSATGQWKSRHDLLQWAEGKTPGSDENVRVVIFDVLYYHGEDLHSKSYGERLAVLNSLKLGPHVIKATGWTCSTEVEFKKAVDKARRTQGSDGAMLKSIQGDYPLTGRTGNWAKFKNMKEIDVVVLEVYPAGESAHNFLCGYALALSQKEKYTPTQIVHNTTYGVLGKTFNTKIKCEPGEVITIGVLEIKKKTEDGKTNYTWFHPRFLNKKPGKSVPDGVVQCERIYQSGTGPTKSFEEVFFSLIRAKVEPQWTIQPGDKFEYSIQAHLRGLEKYQTEMLNLDKVGYEPETFQPTPHEYEVLHSIVDAPWEKLVRLATNTESSSQLQSVCNKIDVSELPQEQLHILAKVGPISIHQDLRMVVEGRDYFEGGHWVTPGNQFKENRLLKLDEGVYSQFMIKEPHKSTDMTSHPNANYDVDWIRAVVEPVIRGPKSWLYVGSPKPLIVPPSSIGATPEKWAVFNRVEFAKGEAGRQTASSGSKHFKLFRFDGKILNGYIIFMFAPLGGRRIWVTLRPKNQSKYAEEFNKPQSKALDDFVEKWYQELYSWSFPK